MSEESGLRWNSAGTITGFRGPVASAGQNFRLGFITRGRSLVKITIERGLMRDLARAMLEALGEVSAHDADAFRAARIDVTLGGLSIENAAARHEIDPDILATWMERLGYVPASDSFR